MTGPARRPSLPVGVLIVAFLVGGLLIDVTALQLRFPTVASIGLAFCLAGLAFAVTEAVVMHVELGKNAHTVSLAELTLTVSLFFVPSNQLLLARLLGGGAVLVLVRRQRPLKLAFNLALWTLDVAVASLIFRQLGGALDAGTMHMVLPALAAALSAALVDSLAVNMVIAATSFELDLPRALRFFKTCMLSGLGCAVGALVCVGAMAHSPWLLLPAVLMVGLYLFGFHNLGSVRAQHNNVKEMYDFSAELGSTSHSEQVIGIVLRRVAELLRAERATLYLHDAESGSFQVTSRDDDGLAAAVTVPVAEVPPLLVASLDRQQPVLVRSGTRDVACQAFLEQYGAKDAVLAPLSGEQGLNGVLVLSDRLGEVNTFTKDDGLLLHTLTSHA
ncbi:MAG: GAF domain-containing protein, partial [Mycobacteriales bacterium]